MARRATTVLDGKTARLRLKARAQPYYAQVGPRITLGYVRRDPPPGTWVVREKVDGLFKRHTLGTADDIAYADGKTVLAYHQAVQLAANGGPGAGHTEPITVKRAAEQYLTALAGRSLHSEETRQRAEKHIYPTLGRIRVARLTKKHIEDWRAGLVRDDTKEDPDSRRRSQDSANRILNVLKAILNSAFEDDANDIPTDSAWRKVKAFRNVDASRPDHFNATQVRTLIAKAATFDRPFADLCEAGYLTGARLGELVALEVRDFDERRAILTVRKGKTGSRAVTLTGEAVRFFRRHTSKRPAAATLFPRGDGNPWGKSHQAKPFKKAAKLAELPPSASFYALRHSHISQAVAAGMPLPLLAQNVGTSVTMIERNYFKMLAETRREQIEATSPKLRRVK